MSAEFSKVRRTILDALVRVPAIQVCVLQDGKKILHESFGFLDLETR